MLDRLDVASITTCFEAALDGIVVLDETSRYLYANPAAYQMMGYTAEQMQNRDLFMDTPLHAQSAMRQHVKEVAAEAAAGRPRPHLGSGWLVRADGEEREIEWIVAPLFMDGQKRAVVMFRDMTEARRIARKAEALEQVASVVAGPGSLGETLNALARRVVEATGTQHCELFLIDEQDRGIRVYGMSHDADQDELEAWEAAVRGGAPAPGIESVHQGKPVVVRDPNDKFLADQRYAPVHDCLRRYSCGAMASLPLHYGKRTIGWMNVSYAPGRYPSEAEVTFLGTIANQAAVAAEMTRLLVEAREKAALEERQRLARELHDSVSQALYGIALGARTARTLLDRDPSKAGEPIEYVLSLAEAGLAEMRALIFELRPESLKEEGLIAAITKQIESVRARHKIAVEADLPGEPEIPLELKEAVYRIAQEALTNTVKHARANRIVLQMDGGEEEIVLEVSDDGVGFDGDGSYPGHFGLRSMRERAAGVGGTLEVETAPGSGTRIRARIPVHAGA